VEYLKKSFKVALASEKYRSNWDKAFCKSKRTAKVQTRLSPGPKNKRMQRPPTASS
jgi:hypothetical protein